MLFISIIIFFVTIFILFSANCCSGREYDYYNQSMQKSSDQKKESMNLLENS
jgi:hypothetical protein